LDFKCNVRALCYTMVEETHNCIDYHLVQCTEAGWSDEELTDALNVALIVGGSIVIPHLRHAMETIDQLRAEQK
jgi:alkylhydroperoxidase/carboxymuconolactone decarboxylase family protein YurZ